MTLIKKNYCSTKITPLACSQVEGGRASAGHGPLRDPCTPPMIQNYSCVTSGREPPPSSGCSWALWPEVSGPEWFPCRVRSSTVIALLSLVIMAPRSDHPLAIGLRYNRRDLYDRWRRSARGPASGAVRERDIWSAAERSGWNRICLVRNFSRRHDRGAVVSRLQATLSRVFIHRTYLSADASCSCFKLPHIAVVQRRR